MPEVRNNIDMTSGNLGLTDQEENQIVAFLQTLSDGFTKSYPNSDVYTGACRAERCRQEYQDHFDHLSVSEM